MDLANPGETRTATVRVILDCVRLQRDHGSEKLRQVVVEG